MKNIINIKGNKNIRLKSKKYILNHKIKKYKITCPDKIFRDLCLSEMQISEIYFLIKRNRIVYIGKSIDLDMRLYNHKIKRKINFDHYYYIEYLGDYLSIIEAKYILKFLPPENKYVNIEKAKMNIKDIRPKTKKFISYLDTLKFNFFCIR